MGLRFIGGAGALRSTAADLTRLLGVAIGWHATPLDSAVRLTLQVPTDSAANGRLGWFITRRANRSIIYAGGRTGGFRSFIGLDQNRKRGVVVLSNSTAGIDDIGLHILDANVPLMAVREIVGLPSDSLLAYVGEYEMATGRIVRVRLEGNQLVAQVSGLGTANIYPSSRDKFFAMAADVQVTFTRDSRDQVSSLVLHVNGDEMPAHRSR